jgi:hypothetical protein
VQFFAEYCPNVFDGDDTDNLQRYTWKQEANWAFYARWVGELLHRPTPIVQLALRIRTSVLCSVYGVYPAWLNLQGRQWTAAGSDYQPTAHHVEDKGAQLHRVKKRKGGKVKKLV